MYGSLSTYVERLADPPSPWRGNRLTLRMQTTSDSLDAVRMLWYLNPMITSVRNLHRKNMTRSRWAMEGVAR